MAFSTNEKFAADKKITLIGPTYSSQEEKIFFRDIFGDQRRYLQVLINFVNNAIKFTMSGGSVTVMLEIVDIGEKIGQGLAQITEVSHENNSVSGLLNDAPDKEVIDRTDSIDEREVQMDSSENDEGDRQSIALEKLIVDISFKITVRDTGVGISEANREKLFKNFSKLEETKG